MITNQSVGHDCDRSAPRANLCSLLAEATYRQVAVPIPAIYRGATFCSLRTSLHRMFAGFKMAGKFLDDFIKIG
jgi:hypothetical protein